MDWWIFLVGLGTFGLLLGGVAFTFAEFKRLNPPGRDPSRQ
jgi:hypothetical protein